MNLERVYSHSLKVREKAHCVSEELSSRSGIKNDQVMVFITFDI